MRKSYEDSLNNVLTKMFNTNRDYIDQEIARLGSPQHRSIDFRRNGTENFGARQLVNFCVNSGYATIGTTMSSTKVS